MIIHFDTNSEGGTRTLNALMFYDSLFDKSLKSFIHQLIIITNNAEAFYRMEGSNPESAPLFMTESNYAETLEYEHVNGEIVSAELVLPQSAVQFRDKATDLLSDYLNYDDFNFEWTIANNAPEDSSSDFKIPEKFLRRIQGFNWPSIH